MEENMQQSQEVEQIENTPAKKKKLTKFEKWYRDLHRFERICLRPVMNFTLHGNVKKFDDRAYLFVGNHYSVYDIVFACMLTNNPIHFVAKKDLLEKKSAQWFYKKCEVIPVSRDGTDARAVIQMMRLLKNGENIGIYPEGTRNHSYDEFLPFKSGAAAIAIKTKTPIVPFAIVNRAKPFRRTHIVVGEPIEFSEYYGKRLTEEEMQACDNLIRDTIWNLRQDFLNSLDEKTRNKICRK